MIAHSNVIAQCLQVYQITPLDLKRVLAVLPSFHITGLVHALHLPVLINAEVIMLPSFDMKSMLDTVVEYQIKEMLLVPPILIRMVCLASHNCACMLKAHCKNRYAIPSSTNTT